MNSYLKFYASQARMKGVNISGHGRRFFDSDFSVAKIEDSFFIGTDFRNCDLSGAKFYNVSFKDSCIYRIITDVTGFVNCDFTNAYMNEFTFDTCVFEQCNFTRCNMESITFKDCTFIGCDFKDADLPPFFKPLQMSNCKNVPYMPMACPEEGEFVGYKIASDDRITSYYTFIIHPYENLASANVLVTLKIPADAKRSSAGGRKCRCNKAEVIEIEHVTTHENLSVAYSKHDTRFEYHIGEEISEPNFNENRWGECSEGIHFFVNRKEALQYYGLMEAYYGGKQC